MAQRLRLVDVRLSRAPQSVGLCQSDLPSIAQYVDSAQRRLILCKEAGEEGWHGTFAEMVFNVFFSNPYITAPREVARFEVMQMCEQPIYVQNQFYEYLKFGNGRLPKVFRGFTFEQCYRQAFQRNMVPTFTDMTNPPQFLAAIPLDPSDVGKRVLFQGTDSLGNTILSQDGTSQVQGVYVSMTLPIVQTTLTFSSITGIQKDVTSGAVQILQVDPVTGAQILLSTLEPSETTAWYRRYYINALPLSGCCPTTVNTCTTNPCPTTVPPFPALPTGAAQILVIAKLDPLPVRYDTDYLLIQNLEAITEEMQSIRYSQIDSPAAQAFSVAKHKQAVGLLNGELVHQYGKELPAIEFRPFGSARLERVAIGMI